MTNAEMMLKRLMETITEQNAKVGDTNVKD